MSEEDIADETGNLCLLLCLNVFAGQHTYHMKAQL